MSLLVDKYRPTKLEQLDVHPELTDQLMRITSTGDFPHMLFYGPSGGGKKTRVAALLRQLFGPGSEKARAPLPRSLPLPSNSLREIEWPPKAHSGQV